ISAPASGIARTSRPYVIAIGMSSSATPKKPSIAPAGPPRASQSSMMTSQPTPTMLPKPNVKYSSAPRVRRRLVGRDSKLVFQRFEQPRGALHTGRSRLGGALEIARRAGRIFKGAIHRFDRHARLARHVRVGPQAQAMRPGKFTRLEPGVALTHTTHGNRVGRQ